MITPREIMQIAIYVAALTLLTPPLGKFMAKVFKGERTFLSPVLGWLERLIYKLAGIDPAHEMDW
jgi:K+-transporting ATPase ATPase A chain